MMAKESAREQRLAKERCQELAEISQRACHEASRRAGVLAEGVHIAETVSLAHAAKNKFKSQKLDAVICETKRINHFRKSTSDDVSWAMSAMRDLISLQRTRSVLDTRALHHKMGEIIKSMQASTSHMV
jgi:hypothetical protein